MATSKKQARRSWDRANRAAYLAQQHSYSSTGREHAQGDTMSGPKYSAASFVKRERDAQRRGAYRFEQKFLATPGTAACLFPAGMPCDLRARRKILQTFDFAGMVASIWNAERTWYGHGLKDAPSIRFAPMRRNAFRTRSGAYCVLTHSIVLHPVMVDRGVIIHEIAHALAHGNTHEAHGPAFLGVLIGLYLRHGELARPVASIVEEAHRAGLRVDCEWIQPIPAEAAV